jgi:hypothetical protein
MTLSRVESLIDGSSYQLPGFFKTVVQGASPVSIEVTITSVTEGPFTPLIFFQSDDPLLAKYGGIAAGMSGSPLYVHDPADDTDKVVGAVSYGESFALGGAGLATPIENMVNIRSKYSTGLMSLQHPTFTKAGLVDSVFVAPSGTSLSNPTVSGAPVMKPLSNTWFIGGGIRANSRLLKRAQNDFAKHGVQLVSARKAPTPPYGDSSFSLPVFPGSSLAVLGCSGDAWFGAIGTVSYVDSDTLLAFGHPATDSGRSYLFMHSAWIDGIWPSSYDAYKLGRPGALMGRLTQDRGAGVMGDLSQRSEAVTLTAEATLAETGESTSTESYMPRHLLDDVLTGDGTDEEMAEYGPLFATYAAGARLFDQDHTPGSAQTTTTIVVRDVKADTTLTVEMHNLVDDDYDIPSAIVWDASDAIESFRSLLDDNLSPYEILSVDVQSSISTTRHAATIVDVNPKTGALKTGDNTVTVSFLAYGEIETQTVDANITIPAGMSTRGTLSAISNGEGVSQFPSADSTPPASSRATLASTVKALNQSMPGNYFVLRYTPIQVANDDDEEEGDEEGLYETASINGSLVTTIATDWALNGSAMTYPTLLSLSLEDKVMDFEGFNVVYGSVFDGPSNLSTVTAFALPAGSTIESNLGTTSIDPRSGTFEFPVWGFTTTTQVRFRTEASSNEGYMATDATISVPVRAYLAFGTSATSVKRGTTVKLTAKVYPRANAGSSATFEYYSNKKWRKIATAKLSGYGSYAVATVKWKALKGSTKLRVRFLGSSYNAATTSGTRTVKGR